MFRGLWPTGWALWLFVQLLFMTIMINSATTLFELSTWHLTNGTITNNTEEYMIGFGNDPFGEKILEASQYSQRSGKRRRKRSVVHLYNMVSCATGCNPLTYKGYGCYCGFLGSGFVVDGIDRCCQMHDWCYDATGCPMFLEYFVPYLWKCYHNQPLCAIELGSPGSCGQRLCQCDQLLAQCLRRYPCPSSKAICTSSPWRLFQNIFML